MESDSYLRNIVQEIKRECENSSIQVHENFLNYYVQLLILDPVWGITHYKLNRANTQNFIRIVVETMKNQKCPTIVALKMQFYFECNLEQKNKIVDKNRAELEIRLKPLFREITHMASAPLNDLSIVYKKMVYYITLASGLGNPVVEPIYKEVLFALKSILNERELEAFLQDPKLAKQEQLREFTTLVTGIRLFNRDCEKGGQGIEDLPTLMSESLAVIKEQLQNILIDTMDKVNLMTSVVDHVYETEKDARDVYYLECHLPEGRKHWEIEYTKDYLILYRQYEIYIRKLISEAQMLEDGLNHLFENLQQTLITLHKTVAHRIATPVVQVFPLFNQLSELWRQLQDSAIVLAKLNQMLRNLQLYMEQVSFQQAIPHYLLQNGPKMTDAERLQRTAGLRLTNEKLNTTIFQTTKFKNIDNVHLQYLGFCPWKLVESKGGLVPGNPNMGIARVMNMNYVFSSFEAATAFSTLPEKYIFDVINIARTKPQLINMLKIKDQLAVVQDIKELVIVPPEEVITHNVGIQCETHPIQTNIVKNYMWNVWELKRQAILLARLTKCGTVGLITEKSHALCAVRTQTQEQIEKDVQTKKDNYTNVPKPSTYIFGLRGRKDDKQFVVDLTRPVEE